MATLNAELFEWVDALCAESMAQARNGDTMLVNELSRNPAWMYYFNNVYTTKSISQQTFSHSYPHFVKGLESFKESYDATEQTEERLTTIEDKLEQLLAAVNVLTEGQVEAVEAPAKPKRKRGKKAKDEVVIEAEVEGATTTSTTELDVDVPDADKATEDTEDSTDDTEPEVETEDDASEDEQDTGESEA